MLVVGSDLTRRREHSMKTTRLIVTCMTIVGRPSTSAMPLCGSVLAVLPMGSISQSYNAIQIEYYRYYKVKLPQTPSMGAFRGGIGQGIGHIRVDTNYGPGCARDRHHQRADAGRN